VTDDAPFKPPVVPPQVDFCQWLPFVLGAIETYLDVPGTWDVTGEKPSQVADDLYLFFSQLDCDEASDMPYVAEVRLFPAGSAPRGWLTFGNTFSASAYPRLFDVLGSQWTDGNQIVLPDLSNAMLRLSGGQAAIAPERIPIYSDAINPTTDAEWAGAAAYVSNEINLFMRASRNAMKDTTDEPGYYAELGTKPDSGLIWERRYDYASQHRNLYNTLLAAYPGRNWGNGIIFTLTDVVRAAIYFGRTTNREAIASLVDALVQFDWNTAKVARAYLQVVGEQLWRYWLMIGAATPTTGQESWSDFGITPANISDAQFDTLNDLVVNAYIYAGE